MEVYESSQQEIAKLRIHKSGIYNKFASVYDCIGSNIGIEANLPFFAMLAIYNRTKNCSLNKIEKLGRKMQIIKIMGQRNNTHIYVLDDLQFINNIYRNKGDFSNDSVGIVSTKGVNNFVKKAELKDYQTVNYKDEITTLLWRYINNYGPVNINDFKYWSGLGKADFKHSLEKIESSVVGLEFRGEAYYLLKYDYNLLAKSTRKNSRKIKLLGKFDPLLSSYVNKAFLIDEKYFDLVYSKGAQTEAVILANDKIIGTWSVEVNDLLMNFTVNLFNKVSLAKKKRIYLRIEKITKFYQKELASVNFISLGTENNIHR